MRLSDRAAWVLDHIVFDRQPALNGELDSIEEPWRSIVAALAADPPNHRSLLWQGFLINRSDMPEIVQALSNVKPDQPAPPPALALGTQFATAADIRRVLTGTRWTWESWVPADSVVGIAAFEGMGKTRFMLDLNRRVWKGLVWPDSQPATFPPKTPCVWLCADGQHNEIVGAMPQFELPDEAVIFLGTPDDPYAFTSLDDEETLRRLEDAAAAYHPAFLFIDSLTYATTRDLCEQRSVAIIKTPLVDLVQQHQVNVMLALHLSKEGQALGRRIKGITRTLMHLECPDPEKTPERLRFWVEKTFAKRPAPLGVTIGENGNVYDFEPPSRPDVSRGGRPSSGRKKAAKFIRDALTAENDRTGNDLCRECEKALGVSRQTFWRAIEDLCEAGDLITDGGKGTGKQTLLHLVLSKTPEP
jgi:hypothetical protein